MISTKWSIYEGAGIGESWFSTTIFEPRVFNGVFEYYTPNVPVADKSVVVADVDPITGPFGEGFPCDLPEDGKSGMCGSASVQEELKQGNFGGGFRRRKRGSQRRQRRLGLQLCLNEDGIHVEDMDL